MTAGPAVPVLVLKAGRYVLHDHGGLGVIRSLGRLGIPVYAVLEDRFTPAAFSRYLTGAFIWDTRGLDTQAMLDGMAVIAKRLNRPAVVIPTDDIAAIFVAEQAATLQRWFLLPPQPAALPRTLADKRALYFLCKKMGVACPEAVFPSSLGEVDRFVGAAAFPVMVKATERQAETRRTTWIARTPKQLYAIYRGAERQPGVTLMFQDYIAPADGEDWFYHGYRNARSDCCVGFTGRKLRSHPPFAGNTTLGRAVANDALRHQAEALLRAVSYSGLVDLDYRLDKRDGRYKLLDFNPRIGAQFRLFEDREGVDVARALYLDLTGRRAPSSPPIDGRTFIVEPYDLLASARYLGRGALTLREWRRSLQGPKELAWFSRDDTLPFFMMCLRLQLRAVERALQMRPAHYPVYRMPRYVRGLWRPYAEPHHADPRGFRGKGLGGIHRRAAAGSVAVDEHAQIEPHDGSTDR